MPKDKFLKIAFLNRLCVKKTNFQNNFVTKSTFSSQVYERKFSIQLFDNKPILFYFFKSDLRQISKFSNQFYDKKQIPKSNFQMGSSTKEHIFLYQICDKKQIVKSILLQKADPQVKFMTKRKFSIQHFHKKQIFFFFLNQICVK